MTLVPFPPGDNSSDTFIANTHFNLTSLQHWNYTFYSNDTFSNGTRCLLVFPPYTPAAVLENGTFVNSSSCYSPILPTGARSIIGLVYTCLFAIGIVLTLVNLGKHGKILLPASKRFVPIGRRWQWYWLLLVGACAMVSTITGIDVDRYYLPEVPIVLSNFFWYLMLLATMAAVWESVRHWGSWQERQFIDSDPFVLPQDDRRGQVELYAPLVFYFFWWINFFMVIPRSWTNIEKQRDPIQTSSHAEPTATDIRFKLGAFFLLGAWGTTVFSLCHSIKHYKLRHRGLANQIFGSIQNVPPKFVLIIPLSLAMVAYDTLCAFDFSVSPLKLHPKLGYLYGWGWGSIACIVLIFQVAGFKEPNEDRELIRQRRLRGAEIDAEMGITKKPHWWSRLHGNNNNLSMQEQIARNVGEVGGGRATSRNIERNIEMGNMPVSKKQETTKSGRLDSDAPNTAARLMLPSSTTNERLDPFRDRPRGRSGGENSSKATTTTTASDRSNSTNSEISIGGKPQVIRSMLDV